MAVLCLRLLVRLHAARLVSMVAARCSRVLPRLLRVVVAADPLRVGCVCTCRSIPGYKTRYEGINLVTIRENTEGG